MGVTYFTDLPASLFAPLNVFCAERETVFQTGDIDATQWIAKISLRPVFLTQGGADVVISASTGQRLYDAAKEPKELWFDPELGHVGFDKGYAAEFFDAYLFGK